MFRRPMDKVFGRYEMNIVNDIMRDRGRPKIILIKN